MDLRSGRLALLSGELPYLAQQLPKALERSLDGLKRVAEIVSSMRELAHPDRPEMSEVDLNHVIRNALVVARPEHKYVAEVKTDLAPLHQTPDGHSAVLARLQVGVLGSVKRCTGSWCQISGDGFAGWIEQSALWGVYPDEKIE